MDHKHIDEFDLVDRYLTGKLAGDEITQFEEHFVDCPKCTDRLKTTNAFMEGLRIVASARAPERAPIRKEPLSFFRPTNSRKSFAFAACILLLVALTGAVLAFTQIRRFRAEADQARSAASEWQRRYDEERQLSAATSKDHQDAQRELSEQVAQLRTDLENQKKPAPQDTGQVNLPVLALDSTRGSAGPSASIDEVMLAQSATAFAITVGLQGERGYRDYLMTIVNSQNQVIWKRGGFKRTKDNALWASLTSTPFHPGVYLLTLDGVAGDGSTSVIGKYTFRVRKTP